MSTLPGADNRMATQSGSQSNFVQRLATFLYLRPALSLALLLGPPLFWLGAVYLGSLFMLVVQSFFHLDSYTGKVIRQLTLATYIELFSSLTNYGIIVRTAGMAGAVTLAAAIIAFPLAYYMARYASARVKAALYLAVLDATYLHDWGHPIDPADLVYV